MCRLSASRDHARQGPPCRTQRPVSGRLLEERQPRRRSSAGCPRGTGRGPAPALRFKSRNWPVAKSSPLSRARSWTTSGNPVRSWRAITRRWTEVGSRQLDIFDLVAGVIDGESRSAAAPSRRLNIQTTICALAGRVGSDRQRRGDQARRQAGGSDRDCMATR